MSETPAAFAESASSKWSRQGARRRLPHCLQKPSPSTAFGPAPHLPQRNLGSTLFEATAVTGPRVDPHSSQNWLFSVASTPHAGHCIGSSHTKVLGRTLLAISTSSTFSPSLSVSLARLR